MADYAIPKSGVAYILYTGLVSQADTKLLQSNPTIAAGDFQVSIDGGAFANLATLPTNTPGGTSVKISLSAAEMTGDNIVVACIDAAGAEWCDQYINIQTSPVGLNDVATAVWSVGTRTLTSFGTLVADTTTSVWGAGTRTLTSFGTLVADTAAAVWAAGTRELTGFGTLVADTAAAVWASGARTLTSFGTLVADVTSAVWAAGSRTLTAFGFTPTPSNAADTTAILADTNELQQDWANGGRLDLLIDDIHMDVGLLDDYLFVTAITVSGAGTTVVFNLNGTIPSGALVGWILRFTEGTNRDCAYRIISTTVVPAGLGNSTVTATLDSALIAVPTGSEVLTIYPDRGLTSSQINAEVLDVLTVDTFPEESAVPPATTSLLKKINWLYMWLRNKSTETNTQRKLYADDTTTVVSTEAITDDNVTFTKGEAS